VKVQGLVFLGVRTAETDVMAAFFSDVMGFPLAEKTQDFVRFELPNRDQVELFGPGVDAQAHMTTGPMPEFLVDDVERAQADLEAAGVEILVPVRFWRGDYGSVHFRAPDGNVYGVLSGRYHD
jgi:catechol 2,3-dioxygenase-like lactoylglutathione lyase family enzyme